MTKILTGHAAPQFSLSGVDGKRHSLTEALQHGPAVIAFFKVSCPVCQFTFPYLERIYQSCKSNGIAFWGISQDDARDTREFNHEYGITFPGLIDEENYRVSNQYGLTNVPTVLLVAPDGKVRLSFTGFDKQGLEKVSQQLAEHSHAVPTPLFRPDEIVPDYKPG